MVAYKGKELTRFQEKSGGKNKGVVDGFYEETEGKQKFFIKKPADKGELFAELFAGLLIQEFKERKLIDEVYFPSLICADVIQFDDKSYGLIQPLVSFDELHKVIGTTKNDGSDRSVWSESFWGSFYYTSVTQQGKQFGLSMALMFSLWLGAHSVHSGNIVQLHNKGGSKQFARIDWGDAFRNFADPLNNDNILYPSENRGWFNYKNITKDFFMNYKKIKGLFPAMAGKGHKLQDQLNEDLLRDIVSSALRNIPADLIDQPAKDAFAKYIAMDSFAKVTFGTDGSGDQFATDMASLLLSRLAKISDLKDLTTESSAAHLYESITVSPVTEKGESFPEIIKQWHHILPVDNIDNSLVDLSILAHHFNDYVELLANQCDATNLWQHDSAHSENLFTPYYQEKGEAKYGHAFVSQYKESTVLRRLFTLIPDTLNSVRFDAFESPCQEYAKAHEDAPWVKIQKLLTLGQGIINTLAVIKRAQEFGLDEVVGEYRGKLKLVLAEFVQTEQEIPSVLNDVQIAPQSEKTFFYPIEDHVLNSMTGDQLATLCLEELNHPMPSPLIERIIKNDALWHRVNEAFNTGEFNGRIDDPVAKITRIRQWQHLLNLSAENNARLKEQADELGRKMESQLRDMEERNRKLLSDIETHNKSHREAEQAAQSLKQELAQLGSEIADLQQQILTIKATAKKTSEDYEKQLSSLQKLREAKDKELMELSTQVVQLREENRTLRSDVSKQSDGKALAEQSVVSLKEEIQKQQDQMEELQRQVAAQIAQLQEENGTLRSEVSKQSDGKDLAEQDIISLKEEIQQQQGIVETLQQQLSAKEQENSLLNAQIQEIKQLKEQIDAQKNQIGTLSEQLLKVRAEKQALTLSIEQLGDEKRATEAQAKELEHRYATLNQTMEQLQQHLLSKEGAIAEATAKLREQALATEENAARLIAASAEKDQTELAKTKLQTEMEALRLALRQQEVAASALQQIVKDTEEAERQYQRALEDKKDRQFARMERMAPILLQVQEIEKKAKQLSDRNEIAASEAATLLAGQIRKGVKKYAENGETDETVALEQFKEESRGHIMAAKLILGEHREEWKYILANISLAILLVGVIYIAAALINKQVSGNYTFFSVPESKQKVEQLEEQIEGINIRNSTGG
ncbi:LepB GTPase-activating domain-containing protein [Legionella shakespearei]|uniref:Effector protein B, substrate of the Dot/Icm secretion system n=1 Tax=Legionella shakespearei DSM 23087 TaxID=1122169 RepID=A0A0W0YHL1_9GAMM|nr:LepB GTPase-activating domain-containing protein [Legionella shakespearei]KTD56445.1 effector protein B, substrate of the Dot/Icm secretion system [Legionella shakespearei DSM 23087]